jgi:hypothetical protein
MKIDYSVSRKKKITNAPFSLHKNSYSSGQMVGHIGLKALLLHQFYTLPKAQNPGHGHTACNLDFVLSKKKYLLENKL